MTRSLRYRVMVVCSLCLVPAIAHAHTLSTPYVLPVPFWMYAYGCAAALVLSFVMLGYFVSAPALAADGQIPEVSPGWLIGTTRWEFWLLRVGAVGCLLVTIVAGLVGTSEPRSNINMTLFWVMFLLGFAYLTFFVGDLYSIINPWKVLAEWLQQAGLQLSRPRVKGTDALGYWPALLFYVALIWLELFGPSRPFVLSVVLINYTVITFVGVFLFGTDTWFRRWDVFSVFFRLIASLAPVKYVQASDGKSWLVRFRPPFAAARNEPPEEAVSLVLFVLFMLSSTTYDAIYRTVFWFGMFWRPMLTLVLPLLGNDLARAQSVLENWFLVYQHGGLLLSACFYLAFYLMVLWWARAATGSSVRLRRLAVDFAYSLIPIALAYNATHYYPMLLIEGQSLLRRASDPLGVGWNLLSLRPSLTQPELQMGVVWHTQVALILVGHIMGVYLAHVIALRTFAPRRGVIISQVPLLSLMVALTAIGLWVLSLPLAG